MARKRKLEPDGRPAGSRERRSRSGTPWKPRRKVAIVRKPRTGELPKRFAAKLGKMPDRKVAELAGVHPNTVLHERHRLGIAPFQPISPPVRWTAAMIRKLGTASDREVAAELGLGVSMVQRKRSLLGIPAFHARGTPKRGRWWSPEEIAMLGKMSDRSLARELGLSTSAVADQRTRRGIPPWRKRPPRIVWTKAMLRQVGKVPDEQLARRYGISGASVLQKRRQLGLPPVVERKAVEHTPELLAALRLPLSEARRRTGLNTNAIRALQQKYGFRPPRASQLRYSPRIVARMGKEPDHRIAAEIGASSSAVRQKRKSLGIPAYDGHRRGPRRKRRRTTA